MEKTTLVIMAAGIGSRFGKGIKQLEPVGPNGEIIMDYSIHDALLAGFNKVVFIIRKDIEEEFREIIGNKIEKLTEVAYVFQELTNIPQGFKVPEKRIKPWGTAQAILSCKGVVTEPFVVINADDYYGKEAFIKMHHYLTKEHRKKGNVLQLCMAGFTLGNTLSENGGVTRGLCKVDYKDMLCEIKETHNIIKTKEGAAIFEDGKVQKSLDTRSIVSMNMWGLQPETMDYLEQEFTLFLEDNNKDELKAEFLLPMMIDKLISNKKAEVQVLSTKDTWFGVTYQEDKKFVVKAFLKLTESGIYRKRLYS